MIAQNLKKSILQEAISGRLVSQIESEGTADDLLQQIAKEHREAFLAQQEFEKNKAEISGKTYKPQKYVPLNISDIPESEQPFAIPNSWKWVRFEDICEVVRGGSPRPAGSEIYYNGNIPFLKVADITKDENIYVEFAENSIKEAGLQKTRYVKAGTLLLTNSGATLGVPKITTFDTTFNDGIAAFLYLNDNIKLYCYYFLKSNTNKFRAINQGTGQPNLNTDIIKSTLIPLPPLSEQRRIVSKLESLLPKIDSLSETETRLSVLESTLGDRLWKSVLQEAIAGRLTTQLESDGTADILLDQIKAAHREAFDAEQAKDKAAAENSGKKFVPQKYTPLTFSQIPQSEIPFNIPDNWKWVRLGEICSLSDGIRKTNETYNNLDARYLRGKAEAKTMQSGKFVKKGDDIILVDGENSGEVFAVPEDGYMGSTFKQLVILNGLNKEFVKFFILSKKDNLRNSKKGSAIPHLNKELFFSFSFPLPPLSEQERIVAKLDRLRGALGRD